MANQSQKYILTLDLGSTGLRSHLAPWEAPWALVPGTARPYRTFRAGGPEGLALSFSPRELWQRIAGVLAGGIAASGVRPSQVAAVSLTSQRQGVAFLDGAGATIYVGPNTDLRALFEGASIDDRWAGRVYEATGHLPSFLFAPAKLHWWRAHHPRTFRRIRRVLTLGAWVGHQLTGAQADVPSQLVEAGLAEVSTRRPLGLLSELDLDPALLPEMVDEGTAIGGLSNEAAIATGLPKGTPVVLAGPDTQAALLGTGAVATGDVGVVSGWSTPVQAVTSRPVLDPQRRTWAGSHLLAGRWVAEASAGDTGGTLDMVRAMLGPRASAARLDQLLSKSRVGANMLTAFWGPRVLDAANPGVAMGGLLAPVPITYNAVHAGHVARATVENIAYAIRECLERLEAVTGEPARSVTISGGLAQSPLFSQMVADVRGAPVRRHHHRASAIGAAIAASVPRQEWPDAAREAGARGKTLEPDARSALEYHDLYQRWLRLKERLEALGDEL